MEATREKLVGDVREVLADVDSLFRQAAAAGGDEARQLRRRAEDLLEKAQVQFATMREEVVTRGRDTARATDEWVHDNPWSSIGAGVAIGLVIGFLIARR
jgi:ElaB/YqjD/DUF883 family membrane-anchored ribosome-binding protein